MSGGEIEIHTEEQVNNDPELSAEAHKKLLDKEKEEPANPEAQITNELTAEDTMPDLEAAIEAENALKALRQRAARLAEEAKAEEEPADAGERDDGGRDVIERYPCSFLFLGSGYIIGGMYLFAVVVFNEPNHAGFWIAGFCLTCVPLAFVFTLRMLLDELGENANLCDYFGICLFLIVGYAALGGIIYGFIELDRYLNRPPPCDTSLNSDTCSFYESRDGHWKYECKPCESDSKTGCACKWKNYNPGNSDGAGRG